MKLRFRDGRTDARTDGRTNGDIEALTDAMRALKDRAAGFLVIPAIFVFSLVGILEYTRYGDCL